MSFSRITVVARREFVETVKTKAFVIGMVFMPMVMFGVVVLSSRMAIQSASEDPGEPARLVVIDRTGRIADAMIQLTAPGSDSPFAGKMNIEVVADRDADATTIAQWKDRVREGEATGFLELPADVIDGGGTCILHMRAGTMNAQRLRGRVRSLTGRVVTHVRLVGAGIDADRVEALSRPVPFESRDVVNDQESSADLMARSMTPFIFLFLLFMGAFGVSQGLLTSVIEEKSSRVVEVLLSAISPFELLAGKIMGMAGVGFTLVTSWATAGYLGACWRGMQDLFHISHVGHFIVYYVLGFLLLSSMLAALGSACNTLKEAQGLMGPVIVMVIVPMVSWFYIAQHPNSAFSMILSAVPPMTPMVMILRLTSPVAESVPLWQQIIVPFWLAGWVLITIWAASRIFRVGVLMYGKPPGLTEILRWVRYQ